VPYLVWIAIGQNLRAQPRHALPIVVAIAVGLALASNVSRRSRAIAACLVALVGTRTALDAAARRTTPPPGVQLLSAVREMPEARDRAVAVFAGPSARFFESTELAKQAAPLGHVDDVPIALTRVNVYPRRAFVTSDLPGASALNLPIYATFCR